MDEVAAEPLGAPSGGPVGRLVEEEQAAFSVGALLQAWPEAVGPRLDDDGEQTPEGAGETFAGGLEPAGTAAVEAHDQQRRSRHSVEPLHGGRRRGRAAVGDGQGAQSAAHGEGPRVLGRGQLGVRR